MSTLPFQPKIKSSTTPERLATWIAQLASRGLLAILIRKGGREDGTPVGDVRVPEKPEDFSAVVMAKKVFEICSANAELAGGKVVYNIIACGEGGEEITDCALKIETGLPSVEAPASSDGGVARALDSILSKHDRLYSVQDKIIERLMGHSQELHNKVTGLIEATEKSLSMANERDLARLEKEAEIKRTDMSVDAIIQIAKTFGPVIAAKKFGVDPEMVKTMVMNMTGTAVPGMTQPESKPAASPGTAQPESKTFSQVIASIPENALAEAVASLPEEAMSKLFASVPEENKQALLKAMGVL
jgi:hypothetical protein